MSRRISVPQVEDSPEGDQIKEIDQINRVGGSPAGTCVRATTSRSGRGCRGTPLGAYEMLAARPEWSCRRAARELGVSVGVVHRWRQMMKLGKRPQPPGRPKIPMTRRASEALQRRLRLALENPRKGLVRIIRRLWHNPRAFNLHELRELHEDLFQTSYGIVTDGDGCLRGAPIDPHSIAAEALGVTKGKRFVEYLGVRAFGRATENLDENTARKHEDRVSGDDAPSAYEVQIRERAFQGRRATRRARRRGR